MSLSVDVLSLSIHHKDYWTLWVGCIDDGSPNESPSLFKIGIRGRATSRDNWWLTVLGCRVTFDILWFSFPIRWFKTKRYHRRRNAELVRAVRVEADCVCGHDIQAHTGDGGGYFAYPLPCGICECKVYVSAEHPVCECGHSGDEHAKLGPNLFLGCAEDCDCEVFTPEDIMTGIGRLAHELMEESV